MKTSLPREYVDRPLDISFTLDELERLTAVGGAYQGRLDLNRVGMIGHSLGGYTTLAIAGAPINYSSVTASLRDRAPVFGSICRFISSVGRLPYPP